jgi:hypothetical protein
MNITQNDQHCKVFLTIHYNVLERYLSDTTETKRQNGPHFIYLIKKNTLAVEN